MSHKVLLKKNTCIFSSSLFFQKALFWQKGDFYGPAYPFCTTDHLYLPRITWNGTFFVKKLRFFSANYKQGIWDFRRFRLSIKSWKVDPGRPLPPNRHRKFEVLADLDSALKVGNLSYLPPLPPSDIGNSRF